MLTVLLVLQDPRHRYAPAEVGKVLDAVYFPRTTAEANAAFEGGVADAPF